MNIDLYPNKSFSQTSKGHKTVKLGGLYLVTEEKEFDRLNRYRLIVKACNPTGKEQWIAIDPNTGTRKLTFSPNDEVPSYYTYLPDATLVPHPDGVIPE